MKHENPFDNHLGKIIREKRKKLGLDQQTLAKAVGISRVAIVNMENSNQGAKYEVLYRLCCALHIEPTDLFPKIKPVDYQVEAVTKVVRRVVRQTVTKKKVTFNNPGNE